MARNFKKDYIKKLLGIATNNGYKIDINNYIYNPALDNEYPALRKVIEETPEKITYSTIYYMKYWDGKSDYKQKVYEAPNNSDTWNVVNVIEERVLEPGTRFSLNKLVQIAENL